MTAHTDHPLRNEGRFWAKVDKSAGDLSCWPWTGSLTRAGYGHGTSERATYKSHRRAWALTNGHVPDGMHVLHNCDNPRCCNPSHLRLGTHADNMNDKKLRGRTTSKLTPDEVLTIRQLMGVISERAISRRFGVSPFVISKIKSGANWGHVK